VKSSETEKLRVFRRLTMTLGLYLTFVLWAGCGGSSEESVELPTGTAGQPAPLDPAKLEILSKWLGGGGPDIRCLAFAPNGKTLAVGYWMPPRTGIWDVEGGSQLSSIEEEEYEAIDGMALSPDGKLIALGISGVLKDGRRLGTELRIREVDTGRLIQRVEEVATGLIAFSPDGELFVDGSRFWTMPEREFLRRVPLPEKFWSRGVDFSPDRSLFAISGFDDGTRTHPSPIAFLFQVDTGRVLKTLKCPVAGEHPLCREGRKCDFHPDGKRLAVGTIWDEFYIWNTETDEVKVVSREGESCWNVRFSPNGKLLAVSGAGGTILIWDVNNHKELCTLTGHLNSVYDLQFSPKGDLLASGGMDGTVRLWGPKRSTGEGWKLVRALELKRVMMLGTVEPGKAVLQRLMVRGEHPLRVLAVTCPDPRFRFRVEELADKLHVVEVFFTADRTLGEVSTTIRVETDSTVNPLREVTVRGQVAEPPPTTNRREDARGEKTDAGGPNDFLEWAFHPRGRFCRAGRRGRHDPGDEMANTSERLADGTRSVPATYNDKT